ncbi:MAG: NAD(P)H-dependent oxidoreductase subunit E [Solirubrobacterales bacterium]|nr:NAD(P)H-dependent oxidoreductase subunit E [Solirubrobacterales bacterium]
MSPPVPVPRFGHGSRVPGWDEAVDLTKPPATIPDPATTPVPQELRDVIEAAMAKYPDRRSAAIPALHAAQEVHGWCSPEAIDQVATVMQVTPAYLTSVATFYDMLETRPRPKHHDVYVCTNISCSLRGADHFFDAMVGAAAEHPDVHVSSFECLGACDIAPMASVDGEYVGPLTTDDAARIVDDLRAGRPVLEHKQLRYRRCADPGVAEGAEEFAPPEPDVPRADTAGLGPGGDTLDRPGPTAPIEIPVDEAGAGNQAGAGNETHEDDE